MTVIRRFQTQSDLRKKRKDRKHRFQLRIPVQLWDEVAALSINCGGSRTGASHNSIVNQLILFALKDENIINSILNQYPERPEFIKIRSGF